MFSDLDYKFWIGTKLNVHKLLKLQNKLKKLKPTAEKEVTFKILAELYILYTELVKNLGKCYQFTFQVQKRAVVKQLLEAATRRLLELKNDLKQLELNEIVYVDKMLIAKKLTPYDLLIWRSPDFLYQRSEEIINIRNKHILMQQDTVVANVSLCINLLQKHERARHGRALWVGSKYNKKLLNITYKQINYTFCEVDPTNALTLRRTTYENNFLQPQEDCDLCNKSEMQISKSNSIEDIEIKAAVTIQRAWRKYVSHKIYKSNFKSNKFVCDLKYKKKAKPKQLVQKDLSKVYKNHILNQKLEIDLKSFVENEHIRILQQRSEWIMEDISDHIRAWFREFYDKIGMFHPYPAELETGTVLVIIDESMTPEELKEKKNELSLSKEEKKKRAEKAKMQKQKQKEKERKEKLKEAKKRKKMKDAGIYDFAYIFKTNKNIVAMEKVFGKYLIEWKFVDEYLNKNHEPIVEWITASELSKIHVDLRKIVDEFMRLEYELLQKALAKDNKTKYVATKKKKKKGKKGKGKKKQNTVSTMPPAYENLYDTFKYLELLEDNHEQVLENFIADFNYMADDTRNDLRLTTVDPAVGDIKMVIQDCMYGMGDFAVEKPKSLCLLGPQHTGKKFLCHIIASEIDAILINLSAEKIFGTFDHIEKFLQILMKMARAFQPTLFFVEEAHRLFWKKIPEDYKFLEPRLLQKAISKNIVKHLKINDKIMLLGTSSEPWAGKGGFKKFFQKFIYLPKSEYGSIFILCYNLMVMQPQAEITDEYVLSALAKVLRNYTTGELTSNLQQTLNIKRRLRLNIQPFEAKEILDTFLKSNEPIFPPHEKILNKFAKWVSKVDKFSKLRKIALAKQKPKNRN